jgi:hypothetical protein
MRDLVGDILLVTGFVARAVLVVLFTWAVAS